MSHGEPAGSAPTELPTPLVHPPGFRARRGLNWGSIGLLYASFYLCRYNFPIANGSIAHEFSFSKTQMGWVISAAFFAYAIGQMVNGLITDKIGGRKAMLTGAVGTIIFNLLFGCIALWAAKVYVAPAAVLTPTTMVSSVSSMTSVSSPAVAAANATASSTTTMPSAVPATLGPIVTSAAPTTLPAPVITCGPGLHGTTLLILMAITWGCNGYLQSFGAPGMIKINAAWFHKTERGRFAGIFGFMINLGRFAIGLLAPALLSGFMLFWIFRIPPQHWRWVFWIPAAVTSLIAFNLFLWVKNSPEEAGYPQERTEAEDGTPDPTMRQLFWTIFSNPVIWITAGAYACTGVVRQGIDQWFPVYVKSAYNVDLDSKEFAVLVFGIPLVATLGSLVSGYVSDVFFAGKRAPVAAGLYLIESCVILCGAYFVNAHTVIFYLILISFTANATHSILGTAAAMDIGGRKMAGFASGVIDSFQYYGGLLAGAPLGWVIDHYGWHSYFYFLAPFGLFGAAMMYFARNKMSPKPIVDAPGFDVVAGSN